MLMKYKVNKLISGFAIMLVVTNMTLSTYASSVISSIENSLAGDIQPAMNLTTSPTLLTNMSSYNDYEVNGRNFDDIKEVDSDISEKKLEEYTDDEAIKEEELGYIVEEVVGSPELEGSELYLLLSELLDRETITLKELANILVEYVEITYDNYIYYRYHINDTANLNIIKLYSEGILGLDENGMSNPNKKLTEKSIFNIISRAEDPQPPPRPNYERRTNIPILMYHEINHLPRNGPTGLYVSRKSFSEQLDALKKHKYNTVTMEQLYNHWENDTPIPPNPVVLTFDDGYISHFTYTYPELSKRGMTGTFYIITNLIDKDRVRTSENLRAMHLEGMEIASHTVSHLDARYHTKARILREYKESKEFLESAIGYPVEHFCYPIGGVTQQARAVLRELGYKTSVRTTYGKANRNQGLLDLRRIRIDYNDSIRGFLNKIR